jgi:predicted DNA-binding transcriptional regulator AlpA
MGETSKINPLWSVEETAHYLGIPVKTLYQWKWMGEGPPVRKVGRYLRYDPDEVQAWFRALDSGAA